MSSQQPADTVTVDQRRAIFRAVVEAQDAGMSVETLRRDRPPI